MPLNNNLQKIALAALVAFLVHAPALGDVIEQSLEVVTKTNAGAVQSQRKIDDLSRETRILLEEYRSLRESSEYQADYARELQQLDEAQRAQIESLNRQIAQARITRQRILPLMRSMAEALEQFVVLDLPFHREERLASVVQLRQRLDRPDISVAARFRLLLEAYQLEQDYSATVEAWRGPLMLEGENLSVEYLRLGRTALYYQTLDRSSSGYWDAAARAWLPLASEHNRALARAMRVARRETAPQLMQLPVAIAGGEL